MQDFFHSDAGVWLMDLDAASLAALKSGRVRARDMIWMTVRNRETDTLISQGFWSDTGDVSLKIKNPQTQLVETRAFSGAGGLISVSDIPMLSNLTVQPVTVELSQLSDAAALIRQYDARQAPIEIYRGIFSSDSLAQIAPAFVRFVGFVDELTLFEGSETELGRITLTCVSHTQEMTRFNPATRSDAYQRERDPNDAFRQHVAVVGDWKQKWGTAG